ncbi:DUF559 domain-containing protein [Jonesia quinghaiensis]|uniref:DUF559 domain-containing protein n=1 Tax=Jonesia quinghaiensis TaxID=262806 RepID=UPI00146F0FD7|nr:DUF559 domain-containing protein [Jonesia quinghaiensis]
MHRPRPQVPLTRPTLPAIITSADISRGELRKLVAQRRLVRILPGRYVDAEHYPHGNSFEDIRKRQYAHIAAVGPSLSARAAMSHASAALLHGMIYPGDETTVHVTESRGGSRGKVGVIVHRQEVSPGHLSTHEGLPITSAERTVVDCARQLNVVDALVVADSAAALGLDRDAAMGIVEAMPDRRGTKRAAWVLKHASAGSESPGETRTRALVVAAGLPPVTTQLPIHTDRGRYYADLACTDLRLIIEYDGRDKYGSREDLFAEKLREDALRAAGWAVMRVTARDLRDASAFVHKVRGFAQRCGARKLGSVDAFVVAAFTHSLR